MAFNKMLIPLAFEQNIDTRFDCALGLCDQASGTLLLLSVIDDLDDSDEPEDGALGSGELLAWVKDKQHQRLEETKQAIIKRFPRINVQCQVETGRVLHKVTEIAVQQNMDVIVLDGKRNHGADHQDFGSITRHLMRKSPVPIWTLSEAGQPKPKKVAVAIDINAHREQEARLNRNLLGNALNIASAFDCELNLLHCWTLYGESYLRHWQRINKVEIAHMEKHEKDRRMAQCEALIAAQNSDKEVNIHLIHGYAAKEIPEQVAELGIDLLIMGTVCRTGIAGLFIGNTAESILNLVHCNVVTFKPEEFVSPVLEHAG